MVTKSTDDFKWSVRTKVFNPDHKDDPDTYDKEVLSGAESVKLPGFKGHAGVPVDANLAIYFIQNFIDHYQIEFFKNHPESDSDKLTDAKQAPVLKKHYDDLHKHASKLHGAILDLNYGVTLEKDMILKILSQPKCEGLRFYLCGKRKPKDPNKPRDPYMHLSLVAVGVDKDGYDLNYKGCDLKPNVKMTKGVDVPTNSLGVEYMPPPPYSFGSNQAIADLSEFFDRFVLLNIAKYGTSTPPPRRAKGDST